ncbi:c-type cytochrome [uncultured Chitinophaga sp.]|uniref:c-type cytochrome n=1 Tax=uncultured Chitinophaga sp. TaxID=339340 RepID=UPI0025F4D65B|nr:c-type cytochrome [uncultured Chitinophaga sp.]
MKSKQGLILAAAMVTAVTLCSLSPTQQSEWKAKNLKVMSKRSTKAEVDSVMKQFNMALGVRCNFCHTPSKDDPKKMDFASDENRHKEIARDMMKMTAKIKKKYLEVTCYTCHNGKKEPLLAPEARDPH